MTFERFEDLQGQLIAGISRMDKTKGKEYSRSKDRLANFHRLADSLNISPEKVLQVYLAKHQDAVQYHVDGLIAGRPMWESASEPIIGRFIDILTYYTLFFGLVVEREESMVKAIIVPKETRTDGF